MKIYIYNKTIEFLMKNKWEKEFFWTLKSNTWMKEDRKLFLDMNTSSVYTFISGTTLEGTGTTTLTL